MGQHLGHPGDKKEATDNLSVASFCGGPKEDRTPDLLTASQVTTSPISTVRYFLATALATT